MSVSSSLLKANAASDSSQDQTIDPTVAIALDTTYAQLVGTTPDYATLAADQVLLTNGVPLQAIRSYVASTSSAAAALNATYEAVLGIPIPAEDVTLDESLLANGQTLAGIRAYLSGTGQAFTALNAIYQSVLGHRISDAINADEVQLGQGQSLAGIRTYLAGTSQAFDALNTVYQAVLGQPISTGVISTDETLLAQGQSLAGIQAYLAGTPQAAAAVSATYETVLGRAPTVPELSAAQQNLAANATSSAIAFSFPITPGSGSLQAITQALLTGPEFTQDVSNATQAALGRPANSNEIMADAAEFSTGINAQTLQAQLGELSGGPALSASPAGPAPIALNGAVTEAPESMGFEPNPGPGITIDVYGLLNNDALIAYQADQVTLLLLRGSIATISGFNLGADQIQVQTAQAASFSNLNLTSDGNNGTLLSLNHGGTIDIQGVAPSALHASNFVFV